MATVTVYIYSPFSGSGTITGLDTYCGGSIPHNACNSGFGACTDIGATGSLYLRAVNVNCWKTRIVYTCCTSYSGCNNDYRRILIVDLYGRENQCNYMGSVAYGHIILAGQIVNNKIYNRSQYPLPFLLGTATIGGCPPSPPKCSTGTHSHMEVSNGVRMSMTCGATVNSSTAIYRFTWNNSEPC